MNQETEKKEFDHKEQTLVELLRSCPIDEETWKIILDRPNDIPRDISFDDFRFEDEKRLRQTR